MDWTWMGEPSPLIKLNLKALVETVTVTVMIATVDLVVTVAVTMVVVVHRVEVVVVGIASSVANLDTLLGSAQMGMVVGEVTDMVAESLEMIGMVVVVVMDLTVAVTGLTVVVIDLTVAVTALTVVVTDILVAAAMVEVVVTVVTDLVPTDGLDLEKCVLSRYENPIYYHDVCFLVLETL